MEVGVTRQVENTHYHDIMRNANYMKFTLVGLYNVPVSFGELSSVVAATKMPVTNEEVSKATYKFSINIQVVSQYKFSILKSFNIYFRTLQWKCFKEEAQRLNTLKANTFFRIGRRCAQTIMLWLKVMKKLF